MADTEGIKIHTMRDDLASVRSSASSSDKANTPVEPAKQAKPFPVPARPNNGNLSLPSHGPVLAGRKRVYLFIIGATVLIVLNIIIWGIALIG